MRKITSLAVGLMVLGVTGLAAAEEVGGAVAAAPGSGGGAGMFGKKGQIAIGSDFNLGFTSSKTDAEGAKSVTTITLAPALDFFLNDNLSIGGRVTYQSVKSDGKGTTVTGIGPRVGYNIGLGEKLSIWPRLEFDYLMYKADGQDKGLTKMRVEVFAPILYHAAPHFYLGLGPVFSKDISAKVDGEDAKGQKVTSFGVAFTVGGYF